MKLLVLSLAFSAAIVVQIKADSASGTNDSISSCDREVSRRVRRYLQKDVFSQLAVEASDLPSSCPLLESHDMYADQEDHKRESHRNEWRCLYCNKRFLSEFYLDRHMENMHKDKVKTNSSVCLADYCDMFGCRIRDNQYRYNPEKSSRKKILTLERCSEDKVEKLRRDCILLANSCFGGINKELLFKERVCDTIRCDKGVFRGGIKLVEEKQSGFVLNLFRFIAIVVLLAVAFIYAVFSDVSLIPSFGSTKTSNSNYFAAYKKNIATNRNGNWFFHSIKDAFRTFFENFSSQYKKRQGKHS